MDGWQEPDPTVAAEHEPAAGTWFQPLASDHEGDVAAPAPYAAFGPPGTVARPPGTIAPPPGAARRPRPTVRTRWIVALAGGLVAVLAIATLVLTTVPRHPAASGARPRPSAAATTTAPIPTTIFSATLLRDLTTDLQSGNETAFLDLVAASARPSVRTWWENQQAIGFTTGVVLPTTVDGQMRIDKDGNGTTTVLAGTHNALDPVDGNGKPAVPCERYQIGLHFAGPAATGQITSWTPLDNDPWDQGTPLYVRKAAGVVVAGLPADSKFVNQTLPLAEAAARYDIGLLNRAGRHDLHQGGFVVFVSPGSTGAWFGSTPQPQGWPAAFKGGRTVALPGPGVSADSSTLASDVSGGITGGARVVVRPFEQDHETTRGQTLNLVRDFMLDALAPDNGEQTLHPVPSWALEGIGIMAEDLYVGNANPAPKAYNFGPLKTALAKLPRRYRTGHLPASGQLFSGSLAVEQDWNDVAASVYVYIGTTFGVNRMLASAMLVFTNQNTPFGNVVAPRKKGAPGFYPSRTIAAKWKTALARI